MSHAYFIDSLRTHFSKPSKEIISFWGEDTNIIDTDSGKIRVRDTDRNKPAIILLPDGPTVIEHFAPLINLLAPYFRVVCFDMPGFGFSYPNLRYDYGLEMSAQVIIDVMNALNIKQAALSSSCVNSHSSVIAAKQFPDRISRLILAQTPSLDAMKNQWVERNIPKTIKVPYVGQTVNALMAKKLSSLWFHRSLPKSSQLKEDFTRHASVALHSGGCFCLASIVQKMAKEADYEFKELEIPTTMVWGNKDWSHKNTDFETFLENVPDCDIIEFDNCGHFPNIEASDKFAALVKEISK